MNFDLTNAIAAILWGAIVLVGRALVAAALTDVARRINWTIWGVRQFHKLTPFLRDPVWQGEWEITWEVKSKTFHPKSSQIGSVARCFNSIVLEGTGVTTKGHKIPYGFVGKFSRDQTIITGIWFDRRGGSGGYHGAYQLRIRGGVDEAEGLWLGFSEENASIKSDKMSWKKIPDSI